MVTIYKWPILTDPDLPPDTIEFRSGAQRIRFRLVNVGIDPGSPDGDYTVETVIEIPEEEAPRCLRSTLWRKE